MLFPRMLNPAAGLMVPSAPSLAQRMRQPPDWAPGRLESLGSNDRTRDTESAQVAERFPKLDCQGGINTRAVPLSARDGKLDARNG
jgi:hypothetical protein